MRIIPEEMERAVMEKDEETMNQLESEKRRMHEEISRIEDDAKRLASDYKRGGSEFQARLAEIEKEARGYRGANHPQHASRWGGNYLRSSSSTSYHSTSGFTPITQGPLTNTPGRSGRSPSSRNSRDRPSRTSVARSFMRNLYETGRFRSLSSSSTYR